jgi:hypothetical protein
MSLTKDTTLQELFNFVYNPDHDVQVIPVTVSKPSEDVARYMIVIQGKPKTAGMILAALMTQVEDMWARAEQQHAIQKPAVAAKKLGDEPQIIVP